MYERDYNRYNHPCAINMNFVGVFQGLTILLRPRVLTARPTRDFNIYDDVVQRKIATSEIFQAMLVHKKHIEDLCIVRGIDQCKCLSEVL